MIPRPIRYVSTAVLLGACYLSIRLSQADAAFRRNTAESVRRATMLDPLNGQYQAWLAELVAAEGGDPKPALREATRLDPLNSRGWIGLGLDAEAAGRTAEAEQLLLKAAAIDRLMEPRWTLMNFYFRQGKTAEFWRWAKETFAMSYGNRRPMFELCWQVSQDASLIASKALPPDYPVLLQFFRFLLDEGQADQAAALAAHILPQAPVEDRAAYVDTLNRLQGREGAAVKLWNALVARGFVAGNALDPGRAASVTDGGFDHFPSGLGFDWRLSNNPEVTAVLLESPRGLRITLSGKQPDVCDLLEQDLALVGGRAYRMHFWYMTANLGAVSGLRASAGGRETPDLSSADWRRSELEFRAPASGLTKLTFFYRRPLGHVRSEGFFSLREVGLDFGR